MEETCLIKTKRRRGSREMFFDACSRCAAHVMWLLHTILFKRFPGEGGTVGGLQTQERREGRSELDEVSDYPTSSGTGKNY